MIGPEEQERKRAERTADLKAAVEHFLEPDKTGAAARRLGAAFGPYWGPLLFSSIHPGGSPQERRLDRRTPSDAAQ